MAKKDANPTKKWSHKVKTISTFPPRGIFLQNAETIARSLSSKEVSPKGIGSGIRMVQFFINRAGKKLSKDRKRELEMAKNLMQEKAAGKRAKKR
jgi:tRNA(adenine34) deaminase